MSTRAQARGIAGAVIDGAVRDTAEIAKLGFPVFSRYVCPAAGTFDKIGEWQTIVCIGRVPVRPGDWIVGDRDGLVVVPAELRDRVLEAARQILKKESAMQPLLKAGKSFAEAMAACDGDGATTPAVAKAAAPAAKKAPAKPSPAVVR
jgi:3-hexulose-6-phosphate synthase/6-phospho-3-hexuloisomerase